MHLQRTGYPIMAVILAGLLLTGYAPAYGKTVKALFLGNSYTFTNNLPQVVANLALSAGDTLIYDSNAPGGYTLQQHCTNSTTLSLISEGDWDYVVLQEQSQRPAFPDEQVATEVYPYAKRLDSLVKAHNECAKTVFYVTWGRKNGDALNCAVFPPVCTYEGMDSLLQLRYAMLADSNNAMLSPVASVWRSIRTEHPGIELYQADESHPSAEGTFAAACSFYSVLFQKDPAGCTYSGAVSAATAEIIKHTAQSVVYDSLDHWSRFYPTVAAAFAFTVSEGTVTFTNLSENAGEYTWIFGDGETSTDTHPIHTYGSGGSYEATLVARRCSDTDTVSQIVNIPTLDIDDANMAGPALLYPNPASETIYIRSPETTGQVILSDITGRQVMTITGKIPQKINLESLPAGTYLIRLAIDTRRYTGRFIKI